MDKITGKFREQVKKAKPQVRQFFTEGGKLPPQAVDLEEAVLGAIMLEKNAVNEAIDILKPESFYKESNQRIFESITDLFQNTEPIDILTVTKRLQKKGELDLVGGPFYISQLTNRVASASNIQYHSRIIAQKYIQRELIRIASEIIKDSYDETVDVFDILDDAEQKLFDVAEGNIRKNYEKIDSVVHQAIVELEAKHENKEGVSGVPTGFMSLDRITGGWQKNDMVVIAARPSMGKTAFVLSMARNAAVTFNKPVAFFSLEMSSVQLVNRLISAESGIPGDRIMRGQLEEYEYSQIHSKIKELTEAPLFIDDTPALSIFEFRSKCRRLKQQHDIQLAVIDYLQLMSGGNTGGNREQEISTISRSIKEVAKELNIPIIALSQLSRSVETRGGDKRPMLSDLRESGAIEQDADIVAFLYRPAYYGITEDEEHNNIEDLTEVLISKHRNGATGLVKLRFIKDYAKFVDGESSTLGSAMEPNRGFDGGSMTVQSRMDEYEDDSNDEFNDKDKEDDTPF
jgi:replicative DNA helicase